MRLTLRTMLAYLDDILDPADAQEMKAKIEESEFAGSLVHRIRASMRRLRMETPKLEGKGLGLDPNTVAEYLDNTLPTDRVPDFERVCLESDVHLAEVAACHQILTLVLGEPADVKPITRERVYRIGSPHFTGQASGSPQTAVGETVSEQEVAGATAPAEGPVPDAADVQSRVDPTHEPQTVARSQPEVPEYLRSGSPRRLWPLVLSLSLALLFVVAVVMAIGPPFVQDAVKDLAQLFQGEEDPASATEGGSEQPGTPGASENENDRAKAPSAANAANDGGPAEDTSAVKLPSGLGQPAIPTEDPDSSDPGAAPPEPGDDSLPPATDVGDASAADDTSASDDPSASNGTQLAGIDVLGDPTPPADDVTERPEATPADAIVGHLMSEDQILVRLDPLAGDWYRLPVRSSLSSDEPLLVLPTFRPQIRLVSGLQLTVLAGTSFQLGPVSQDDVPEVRISTGRAVVATVGKADASVVLSLGGRDGIVKFGDADSALAVEVFREREPGSDPETTPPHVVSHIYAASGQIEWLRAGAAPVLLAPGTVLMLRDDQPEKTSASASLPKWVHSSDVKEIDHLASIALQPLLSADRSVGLSLDEQVEHRRIEVRSLAIRSLASLGRYERIAESLSDDRLKSYWSSHFDGLTEAIAKGPESAAAVRRALEKARGADAGLLYRMLWGYSAEDLSSGEAARLVEYLDHDSMDFRVLAIENLRRITGRTAGYRPEVAASRRRAGVFAWREKLENGEIVPKADATAAAASLPAKTSEEGGP